MLLSTLEVAISFRKVEDPRSISYTRPSQVVNHSSTVSVTSPQNTIPAPTVLSLHVSVVEVLTELFSFCIFREFSRIYNGLVKLCLFVFSG